MFSSFNKGIALTHIGDNLQTQHSQKKSNAEQKVSLMCHFNSFLNFPFLPQILFSRRTLYITSFRYVLMPSSSLFLSRAQTGRRANLQTIRYITQLKNVKQALLQK